ncbi:lariat debranching enzyme, C-terminal domain-containing protein [Mycena latifolia]|nr:lariat debranching enzyme, C-terminal domain-containing protein [Mycena latifolia]
MRIAVVGCSHGGLDTLYKTIHQVDSEAKKRGEPPVKLLLCYGDIEAMRCNADLYTMKAPSKFRVLRDFHNYYAGRKRAPIPTIVVGGNHEAMGHMWEWFVVSPRIFSTFEASLQLPRGMAGSQHLFSGVRGSVTGLEGHFERIPFTPSTLASAYHTRQYDVTRLMQLEGNGPKVDIFMSHDWPRAIERHGDTEALLRECPRFEGDVHFAVFLFFGHGANTSKKNHQVMSNTLGRPRTKRCFGLLKPARWCSGHMHVCFTAEVQHGKINVHETTKFLALDKPGVRRAFLEVIDVARPEAHQSPKGAPALFFDPHWLAIVSAFASFLPLTQRAPPLPSTSRVPALIADAMAWVRQNVMGSAGLKAVGDVQVFAWTAPPTRSVGGHEDTVPLEAAARAYANPQTQAFCDVLGIPNQIDSPSPLS